MRRARISPFLLAMTAAVSLASGVGITLVLEDAYNVPYNKIQFDAKNLENLDWEQLLDFLEEHPELVEYVMENWADRIAEMFQNGDFSDIDLESLLELAQNHPEILQGIAEQLAEQILNSGMTLGGLSSEELADLVKNNPELATALLEYLQQNGGDLSSMTTDDLLEFASQHPEVAAGILAALTGDIVSEIDSIKSNRDALDGDEPQPSEDFDAIDAEWEEQGITAGSGGSGAGDGSGGGSAGTPGGDSPLGSSLDRGDLDPNREGKTLFYFTTNYSGTVYIRNQSYGDYNYLIGDFNEPSGYDGELYMVSPVFYTTLAGMNRSSSYDIQFHLGSFRSRSMLSASYSDVSYLDQNNEKQVFSTLEEARVRNRDISEYSSKFYPEMETNYLALPSYLSDEESRYYSYVKRTYLSVPEDLKPALTSFISNHSISKNPYVIEEFFRRKGTYAGMVFNGGTQGIDDPIERFLESSLTGTCSNFASAMTMICRQLGLPARLTNGYLVSASGDKNNVVADTNGHAWVEVYESGKGWIRFDPTPSKGEPAMTEPTILNGDASKPLPSSSQPKNLFQYSNSNEMSDALYFRSTAFGDYDPDTWTFEEKPAIGEESSSSLFTFVNNVENRTNPSFDNVKITMMDGFQDYGAIVPEYARSSVTDIGLSPYDDVRLTRTSQVSYRVDYLSEFEIPSGNTEDWGYRNSILPKYQVLVDGDLK
ncbi:MAG: transglutaminase domain-containing protein, partial [Candidatus Enteromonas sp.]|nr:transglutaminase domain-containing protein [Candidatus Enteromonas sp.]